MLNNRLRRRGGRLVLSSARRCVSVAMIAAALIVTGCASRKQVLLIQEDVSAARRDIDSLKWRQTAMQESLADLDQQMRDMKARSEYGSTALQERIEGLAARMDEIVTRMDRTLAPLEEFIRRQSAEDTTKTAPLGVDYYDAAMRDLSLGNYDLAEVGFLQFLENNPKSDLADDARYGLAETYYARKRYEEAIEEYQRVAALDPQGGKTPAAMLKLGLCHRALKNNRDAQKVWEDLVKRFPYAEETKVAHQRLDELKGGN